MSLPMHHEATKRLRTTILHMKGNVLLLYRSSYISCRNLSLGLATKAKACKVVRQEGNLGVTFHAPGGAKECEGMNPHTPK
jgi:hypothetical protein